MATAQSKSNNAARRNWCPADMITFLKAFGMEGGGAKIRFSDLTELQHSFYDSLTSAQKLTSQQVPKLFQLGGKCLLVAPFAATGICEAWH